MQNLMHEFHENTAGYRHFKTLSNKRICRQADKLFSKTDADALAFCAS